MSADESAWKKWHGDDYTLGEVWAHPDLAKEYAKLPDDARATIRATMKAKFCTYEDDGDIPTTKLKEQGRPEKKNILVWAFKGPGGRVYGAKGTIDGKRVFFATAAAKKKTDKADPKDLKRAVMRLGELGKIPGARL